MRFTSVKFTFTIQTQTQYKKGTIMEQEQRFKRAVIGHLTTTHGYSAPAAEEAVALFRKVIEHFRLYKGTPERCAESIAEQHPGEAEEIAGRICQAAASLDPNIEGTSLAAALVEMGEILRHGTHSQWNFPLDPVARQSVARWLVKQVYFGTPVYQGQPDSDDVTYYGYPFTTAVRQVFLRASADLGGGFL